MTGPAPGPEEAIRPEVRAAPAYERVPEKGRVKLNQNESPWDVPAGIKDAILRRAASGAWNRYPQEGARRVRARLAEPFGVPPDGVLLASGSNLALEWAVAAAAGPGRRALIPAPSFALYRLYGELYGARVGEIPLDEDLRYPVDLWCERLRRDRPALAILCLPNNPTGSDLDDGAIDRIAAAAPGLLLIDEAYREFADRERATLLARRGNVAILRTFSKAFSAAGLRIGYLVARPEIAREIGKLAPPFHAGVFTVAAAEVLLENRAVFAERIDGILRERERLVSRLGAIPGLRALPTAANFFLVRVAEGEAARREAVRIAGALRTRGILVRLPDPRLGGVVRVNVGTPEENDALVEALAALRGVGGAEGEEESDGA